MFFDRLCSERRGGPWWPWEGRMAELSELLTEVHRRLAGGEEVDAAAKAQMALVMEDIVRILAEEEAESGVKERLEVNLRRLEVDHPTAAVLVRRLLETLNETGI